MQAGPGEMHAWLRAAQGGDLEAFNRLVDEYQRQVYNVCYRTLGNTEDAADATQEAFLGAYRGIGAFRGAPDGFRAWLLRVAVNACYDQLRRRRRRSAESLEALSAGRGVDEEPGPADRVADPGPGPEQAALASEAARGIQAALGHLSADQRLTVVLCDIQGMSYEQAAQVMSVELGTVKSRLSRARAQLRDLLQAAGELPSVARRLEH